MHCAVWSVSTSSPEQIDPTWSLAEFSAWEPLCLLLHEGDRCSCGRCGTWFLKQPELFSNSLHFSFSSSSRGRGAVLPLLRGTALKEGKCWEASVSVVESAFICSGGLCLSGYFTWHSHCKCTVQNCGLRSMAPFCTIERNIYCSCLINWTVLKTRLFQLQTISLEQVALRDCEFSVFGGVKNPAVQCPEQSPPCWPSSEQESLTRSALQVHSSLSYSLILWTLKVRDEFKIHGSELCWQNCSWKHRQKAAKKQPEGAAQGSLFCGVV